MHTCRHGGQDEGQSVVEYGLLVAVFGALSALAARIDAVVNGILRLIGA